MNILAIDIGTYSIKYLELRPERKNLVLLDKNEIIIEEARPHYPPETTLKELQKEIVANLISKKAVDTKVIFQIPNELITTRYLEIPGQSKKKAEQIIPFQLDENLPYSLNEAHFSSRLIKNPSGFSVISNITQINFFKDFLNFFEKKEVGPSIMTSELSAIQAYLDHIKLNDDCCILDIGHKTTKAYFVHERKIVANHTSYIAGSQINEVISKTYQIGLDDAIIYKHENAFFLADDQLDEVKAQQKDFAILMKQIFSPLILEFKRWEVGYRIKFGHSISRVYLIGGTSEINGIAHFINYHTAFSVHSLDPVVEIKNDHDLHNKSFFMAKMIAVSERIPSSLINFLTGTFQNHSNSFIPAHSAVFIWVRSTFLALIILAGLLIERYSFLQYTEKMLDTKISTMIKANGILNAEIPKNVQRDYKKYPQNLLKAINKKDKSIRDEVSSILSSTKINAIKPLAILSRTLNSSPEVTLTQFNSDGTDVQAVFNSTKLEELKNVEKSLKSSGLFDLKTKIDEQKIELNVNFTDRE